MHDELKLIEVTIDDSYRASLRFLRFIIEKRRVQTLENYIGRKSLGKRVFIKAMLWLLDFFLCLVGVAIAAILGGV